MSTAVATAQPKVPATMTTSSAAAMLQKAEQLEKAASDALEILNVDAGAFQKTIRTSIAIQALQAAMTEEVMETVMRLANMKLGFTTDRDPGKIDPDTNKPFVPYSVPVVRNVLIEGALRGARWTGNEITIISGGLYLTQSYWERMVREYPGVANVDAKPGVPVNLGDDGALVPYVIEWDQVGADGKSTHRRMARLKVSDNEDHRFVVRRNKGMGTDGLLGKARKRAFAAVYSMLTGREAEGVEPDDSNTIDVTATTAVPAKQIAGSAAAPLDAGAPWVDPKTPALPGGAGGQAPEGLFGKQPSK